ncbi:MAG: hypothetical protein ACLUOI_33495 [Eisenbergiella sp.]
MEGVLLQESQADYPGDFQHQLLVVGKYVAAVNSSSGNFLVQDP